MREPRSSPSGGGGPEGRRGQARLLNLSRDCAELMERARGVRASPGVVFVIPFRRSWTPRAIVIPQAGARGPLPPFTPSPCNAPRFLAARRACGADPRTGGSPFRQAPDGWVYVPHPHLSLQARLSPLLQPRSIASPSHASGRILAPSPCDGTALIMQRVSARLIQSAEKVASGWIGWGLWRDRRGSRALYPRPRSFSPCGRRWRPKADG